MFKNKRVIAIITAGGKGLRMGNNIPKQFLSLGGVSIIEKTVRVFSDNAFVDEIIITLPEEYVAAAKENFPSCKVLAGGEERQDSVRNALTLGDIGEEDLVLIHDGVRPYCDGAIIERVLEGAFEKGAAIPGVPSKDTIRHLEDGTLDRGKLVRVQTPQGFRGEIILESYDNAEKNNIRGTDDASLAEALGYEIAIVEGSEKNIKITTKEDLPVETRIGMGYDVHVFAENRKLILCGVDIPWDKGLLGHSDADVATHALMDALLGAAGLPDIGRLFPDNDPAYEGADSIILLKDVVRRLAEEGYSVGNVDITIICQKPKLADHIDKMKKRISEAVGIEESKVGIKATTTEKLGFVGREEGIAAEAVCLIKNNN